MSGAANSDISDQAEVLALLGDPRSHAGGGPVVHLETHGAHVFLVGDLAYKIKRAVRLPYLDYSSMDKRLAMLARELEINRRFAPEIYLGIVPVGRCRDGKLRLAGDGAPVEYALMMRRFEQSALLLERARAGAMDAALAPRLAAAVAESHAAAPAGPLGDGAKRVLAAIEQISGGLDRLRKILGAGAAAVGQHARDQLARASATLDRRAADGHVRRCHGDLHLGNIVMLDGGPKLFDALEFDDDLATTDTLYDLAFLLMDLDRIGTPGFAGQVRDAYLRARGYVDLDGLVAMPLFLALRAAVRAVVHAERAGQSGAMDDADTARLYLGDALSHLAPPAPRLIAIGGLSGTGKTTVARALAPLVGPRPGAIHLRSDVERKIMLGRPELERLDAEGYAPDVTASVYARLCDLAARALAAGQSVIVDAVFSSEAERAAIADAASRVGVPFYGVWLVASPQTMLARVEARRGDASDASHEVVEAQIARGAGTVTWSTVESSGEAAEVLIGARRAVGLGDVAMRA